MALVSSRSSSSAGDPRDGTIKTLPPPSSFKCPITLGIMSDPVVTCDGHVYERAAIESWIRRGVAGQILSPITGLPLMSLVLTPEAPLKRAIEEYLSMRPELERTQLDCLSLQTAAATLEEELLAKSRRLANPQDESPEQQASLIEAVFEGDAAHCVQLIVQGIAFVNEQDRNGCTALHYAVKKGLTPVVFALLDDNEFAKASALGTIDGVEWTALELAVAHGHQKMASAMTAYIEQPLSQRQGSKRKFQQSDSESSSVRARAHASDALIPAEADRIAGLRQLYSQAANAGIIQPEGGPITERHDSGSPPRGRARRRRRRRAPRSDVEGRDQAVHSRQGSSQASDPSHPGLSDPQEVLLHMDFPKSLHDWVSVQNLVFAGHPPLPEGWIRAWSRSKRCVYHVRMLDNYRTRSLSKVH